MNKPIKLQPAQAGASDPRRLNAFPGRHLGEREFEILQAYVDDRVAPLVATLPPGIISGLNVITAQGDKAGTLRLHFQPGSAVAGGGRLVRLFNHMDEDWDGLVARVARENDFPVRDGYYFLTLRSQVEARDDTRSEDANTRTEPDPLRARRWETVTLAGLQRITTSARLLAMPQTQAANRLCVRFLSQSPFDAKTGQVPVALVKIVGGAMEWIDPVAGRFLSGPNPAHQTFLAHWIQTLRDWHVAQAQASGPGGLSLQMPQTKAVTTGGMSAPTILPDQPIETTRRPIPTLAEAFGVDYLPAAGPFPSTLLADPAAVPTPDAIDLIPRLNCRTGDLQIELAAMPANTVAAMIETEMARGPVDLVHDLQDRIRLLLAIPDPDYRPDLLTLPVRDTALEVELYDQHRAAHLALMDWTRRWLALYQGLGSTQLKSAGAPVRINPVQAPTAYLYSLCAARPDNAPPPRLNNVSKAIDYNLLPKPEYVIPSLPSIRDPGLCAQAEKVRRQIMAIEADLQESYQLINEMTDYLALQRQNYDSLSVSFSVLSGGVAGDASGQSLIRWINSATLIPMGASK
jgi:hypothetical protein